MSNSPSNSPEGGFDWIPLEYVNTSDDVDAVSECVTTPPVSAALSSSHTPPSGQVPDDTALRTLPQVRTLLPKNTPLSVNFHARRYTAYCTKSEMMHHRRAEEAKKWIVGPMPVEGFLSTFLPEGDIPEESLRNRILPDPTSAFDEVPTETRQEDQLYGPDSSSAMTSSLTSAPSSSSALTPKSPCHLLTAGSMCRPLASSPSIAISRSARKSMECSRAKLTGNFIRTRFSGPRHRRLTGRGERVRGLLGTTVVTVLPSAMQAFYPHVCPVPMTDTGSCGDDTTPGRSIRFMFS